MMGSEILKKLAEIYAKPQPKADVFGRRQATQQDFGSRPATPSEIARAIGIEETDFTTLVNNNLPTSVDIKEKGDD